MLIDRIRDRLASYGIELQDRTQVWAVLAVAAIVVAAVVWLYGSSRPDSVAVRSESAARASPEASEAQATTSQSSEATIAVHVAGAVRRPGMVCLAKGARINDAVQLAGGPLPGADLNAVNLATKVTDGQQIVVPRKGETAATGSTAAAGGQALSGANAGAAGGMAGGGAAGQAGAGQGAMGGATVELNSATVAQFDSLPGIGPVLAQRIFDYRNQHGKFTRVEDLRQVEGIGPKKFEQLKSQVTCSP